MLFRASSIVVVQSPSCIWLFKTPWTTAHQASLSFTISWSLPKFMSVEAVIPSNHLILCCCWVCHLAIALQWAYNEAPSPLEVESSTSLKSEQLSLTCLSKVLEQPPHHVGLTVGRIKWQLWLPGTLLSAPLIRTITSWVLGASTSEGPSCA